ncbi:putative transcriptional regulator [Sedimentisphaera cyanobacteriorum]|uniref:Putative transcriptional regulator n=2 Tax=Sedimentisphaera cyanobacteriorum TaxID=1940790 RepID=A0A1Q2HT19_9BACT|nr:putative transcriptional regulator [Sedimentisphaera cyanobacteriorum]
MRVKVNRYKVKKIMADKQIHTFTDLAYMLGISKNQLSNILSNKFNPVKSNIQELADFLEVSPSELIEQADEEE